MAHLSECSTVAENWNTETQIEIRDGLLNPCRVVGRAQLAPRLGQVGDPGHLAESVGADDLDGSGVLVLPRDDCLAADHHHLVSASVLIVGLIARTNR